MQKHRKAIPLAAKVIGGIAFMALFILNTMLLIEEDKASEGLSLASLKAFADDSSEEASSGGTTLYIKKIFWHPLSWSTMWGGKLRPSESVTSSASCADGSLSVYPYSFKIEGGGCKKTSYNVSKTMYECETIWATTYCELKEEYTEYTYTN